MIVGLPGIIAGGGGGVAPYGTFLYGVCTETTITDASYNYFTGYYNKENHYADGTGGSYIVNSIGESPCHYPYGFYLTVSSNPVTIYWEGCSSTGYFYDAGTQNYSEMADGAGGVITNDSISWNYSNGYYIYDNGTDCRIVLDTQMYPYYYVDNYSTTCPMYGDKVGTPYWVDGEFAGLYQNYADGSCGTYQGSWDNNPPYPAYGVQMSLPSYFSGAYDANNVYWEGVTGNTYTYSDGYGGTYTSTVYYLSGYYGFALTATGVNTNNYDMMWSVYDSNNSPVYPWVYGYMGSDGSEGSTFYVVTPSYYTILSPYFYEYWSGSGGYIYADGTGGYFFGTSSPP
jgi:hypothetical protein